MCIFNCGSKVDSIQLSDILFTWYGIIHGAGLQVIIMKMVEYFKTIENKTVQPMAGG